MGFLAALKSLFSGIVAALGPRHSWRHDEERNLRTCTCCGRREALIVDLVSSEWQVLELGDETAHARETVAIKPEPKAETDLLAARTDQTAN